MSSVFSLSFAELQSILPHICLGAEKYPVMLRGPHGIGKSELVRSLLNLFNEEYGANLKGVIELRASQLTEGDVIGLPVLDKQTTDWYPPVWHRRVMDEPMILFLDELDRGTPEVRQAFFELGDSRKINGRYVHKDTIIIAAVNGGQHEQAGSYQVAKLDPAELDRWWVCDVKPSVSDWLSWAKNRMPAQICDYISKVGEGTTHFEHKGRFEPDRVYPSRRSWARFATTLQKMSKDISKISKEHVINIGAGYVGFETAVEFASFLEGYINLFNPDDILKDGKFEIMDDWDLPRYQRMIDAMADGPLQGHLSESEIYNLAIFASKLPAECWPSLWYQLCLEISRLEERTYEELKKTNLVRFHQTILEPDGKHVLQRTSIPRIFVGVLTGNQDSITETISKMSEKEEEQNQ